MEKGISGMPFLSSLDQEKHLRICCSSRLYDYKRQSETTEVLVKKCNEETDLGSPGEREDEEAVANNVNYVEIDLTGEPTGQQSLEKTTIDMLFEDLDEHENEDNLEAFDDMAEIVNERLDEDVECRPVHEVDMLLQKRD